MFIKDEDLCGLSSFIRCIYTGNTDFKKILTLSPLLTKLTSSHYFGIMLLPNLFTKEKTYLTNNSDSYVKIYSSLMSKDFILKEMLETGKPILLDSFEESLMKTNREFCINALRGRPIADLCYVPIRVNGFIAGYTAVSREGLTPKVSRLFRLRSLAVENSEYSTNDIEINRFISGFINEFLKRSMLPAAVSENKALLDKPGRIVNSGGFAKDIIRCVFGKNYEDYPGKGLGEQHRRFHQAYEHFLRGPAVPGKGEVSFNADGRDFLFVFRLLPKSEIRIYFPNEPQAEMAVYETGKQENNIRNIIPVQHLRKNKGLTPRETEIVYLVYKGHSNRETADMLGIAESTVKSHLSCIYEKTGAGSRSELFFKINS